MMLIVAVYRIHIKLTVSLNTSWQQRLGKGFDGGCIQGSMPVNLGNKCEKIYSSQATEILHEHSSVFNHCLIKEFSNVVLQ